MAEAFSQAQIDDALTALVAWAGNASAAIRYLESVGKRAPSSAALLNWSRTLHWEQYEKLREQYAEKVEGTIANDMRDAARAAIEAERIAVQKAKERLEAGKDDDPGKTAANLARVAQSSTDKLLSLTGRPTQITENRDATALLRSLVNRGVLLPPEEDVKQLEAAEDARGG